MGLESGVTYIEDLVATNPVGATDNVDEGDDHIRNIKTAVKGSFPNLGGAAVTKTAAQINDSATKTGTETLTNKTITSPKINAIWDSTASKLVLSITADPAAVNNIIVKAQPTGVAPLIRSSGEADLGLIIYDSNSNELLKLMSVSGATNEITITNSTGGVSIEATGSDTNIDMDITPKGSGTANVPSLTVSTALSIPAGSIDTAEIATDAVGSDEIAADAVTESEINFGALTRSTSVTVTPATPWVVPAGLYNVIWDNAGGSGELKLQIKDSGGTWKTNDTTFAGGLILGDNANVRLDNVDPSQNANLFYAKMS